MSSRDKVLRIAFGMLDIGSAKALRGACKEMSPAGRWLGADVDVWELAAGSLLLGLPLCFLPWASRRQNQPETWR